MKKARILAAVMATALMTGAIPVSPIADYFDNNVITASAETNVVQWDKNKIHDCMKSWSISSVVFLDYKPENGTVSTATSVSSDGSIVAGPASDTSGIMYIWADKGGKIKAPSDCSELFNGYNSEYMQKNIISIDCSALDTSEVVNMKLMFSNLKALTSLNVSGFDTSNVTDMTAMFFICNNLAELDLSSFNTSNVTNMTLMFSECHALKELDLSGFNTCNVTDMPCMFNECNTLASVDVSSFDTHNVKDMTGMFFECRSLTSLNLSNFDTRNVTEMSGMFSLCVKLTDLDLSSFSTNNVEVFSLLFSGCKSLTYVDMSNFTVMNNAVIEKPANDCTVLQSVKCSEDVYKKFGFDKSVKRVSLGLRESFIEGYSLDITNGAFYLNIYTDFPEEYKNYNVTVTLPDGTKNTKKVSEAKTVEMDGKTYTVFPAIVAAKDIGSNIEVAVVSDSRMKIGTVDLSVSDYAYALKNRNPEYSDFIDAMLNYGAYADAYFNNKKYNPKSYKSDIYDDISQKIIKSNGTVSKENYYGSSLLLKNKIILRHYFSKPLTNAIKKGDYWYVEQEFNPTEFDKPISGFGTYTINDYIKKILSGNNQELKNLCCALYEYSQTALNLVKSN